MVKKKTAAMVRSDGRFRRAPTPGATADGRNAYRKMIREQREAFLQWAHDEDPETWRRSVERARLARQRKHGNGWATDR